METISLYIPANLMRDVDNVEKLQSYYQELAADKFLDSQLNLKAKMIEKARFLDEIEVARYMNKVL